MAKKNVSIRLEPSRIELLENQPPENKTEVIRQLIDLLETADVRDDYRSAMRRLEVAEDYVTEKPKLDSYNPGDSPYKNLKLGAEQLKRVERLDDKYINPNDIDWEDIEGHSRTLKADALCAVLNFDIAVKAFEMDEGDNEEFYIGSKHTVSNGRSLAQYIKNAISDHLGIDTKRYKKEYYNIIISNFENIQGTPGYVTSMEDAARENLFQLAYTFAIYDSMDEYVGSDRFTFNINEDRYRYDGIDGYGDIFDMMFDDIYRYCHKADIDMFASPAMEKFAELHRIYIYEGEDAVDRELKSTETEIAVNHPRSVANKIV